MPPLEHGPDMALEGLMHQLQSWLRQDGSNLEDPHTRKNLGDMRRNLGALKSGESASFTLNGRSVEVTKDETGYRTKWGEELPKMEVGE